MRDLSSERGGKWISEGNKGEDYVYRVFWVYCFYPICTGIAPGRSCFGVYLFNRNVILILLDSIYLWALVDRS